MALLRSVATVGGYTMLSRITGFIRDILIARYLGAGVQADAFFAAFRFPNLFRRLFAEGAFAAAYVPLISGKLEDDNHAKAAMFVDQAFAMLGTIVLAVVVAMEICMPLAMWVFTPGFADVPGKLDLTTELSRITFPYLLFISLVSLHASTMNAVGRFAAAAATPVLLNLTLITAIVGFSHLAGGAAYALSYGVFVAGVIQFLWAAWHVRKCGFPMRLVRPRWTADISLLVRRIIPGLIGVGVYQVNLVIGTLLASLVADGAVSYLYYADRVAQLPLGVVGVAIGTALLPLLSRQIKSGDDVAVQDSQNRALEFAMILSWPAAIALCVIATPIVETLFQRGAFDAAATYATASALIAYAIGLPASVLLRVLAPGFYAREDTATPVKVGMLALVSNIALNLAFMPFFGHVGIALAAALSAWINTLVLGWLLRQRGYLVLDARFKATSVRLIGALVLMAGVLYGAAYVGTPLVQDMPYLKIPVMVVYVFGSIGVFACGIFTFKVITPRQFKAMLRR
jgi:putative peptidoglycan lipid II flippase